MRFWISENNNTPVLAPVLGARCACCCLKGLRGLKGLGRNLQVDSSQAGPVPKLLIESPPARVNARKRLHKKQLYKVDSPGGCVCG